MGRRCVTPDRVELASIKSPMFSVMMNLQGGLGPVLTQYMMYQSNVG